jgi:DNA damage-binding protein 1
MLAESGPSPNPFILLKVIPIDETGALSEAFNVRLEELKVLDLAFLHESNTPTLVVLYEDTKGQRHSKTYEISIKDKVSSSL